MNEERIKVAITGSRFGLTMDQEMALADLFCNTRLSEFHEGACTGVDYEAKWLWVVLGDGVCHEHPATINPEWDELNQNRFPPRK